jgi:hypothetical protein
LGALQNPGGYLIAALESAAKLKNVPLESIHWETTVLRDMTKVNLEPGDFIVEDLHLEGAR